MKLVIYIYFFPSNAFSRLLLPSLIFTFNAYAIGKLLPFPVALHLVKGHTRRRLITLHARISTNVKTSHVWCVRDNKNISGSSLHARISTNLKTSHVWCVRDNKNISGSSLLNAWISTNMKTSHVWCVHNRKTFSISGYSSPGKF